jgi:hypothetical protein
VAGDAERTLSSNDAAPQNALKCTVPSVPKSRESLGCPGLAWGSSDASLNLLLYVCRTPHPVCYLYTLLLKATCMRHEYQIWCVAPVRELAAFCDFFFIVG